MNRTEFDVEKFFVDKKIDESNLSGAMVENASLLGYYGYEKSLWGSYVDKLKMTLEAMSAQAELDVRDTSEKMTESVVKAKLACDPQLKKIKMQIAIAREQETLYSNAVNTLAERGKMLISIGATARAEMESMGIHIRNPSSSSLSGEERKKLATKFNG